jgi:hypothetical protein
MKNILKQWPVALDEKSYHLSPHPARHANLTLREEIPKLNPGHSGARNQGSNLVYVQHLFWEFLPGTNSIPPATLLNKHRIQKLHP